MTVTTDVTCGTLTCNSLYGGAVNQIKTNVLSNPTITGNASIGGNLTVTGNTTFTGTVSGIPVGSATQTALDLKANTADVYTKTDMDTYLTLKANTLSPTFTGTVTAPTLTVASDATLDGNLTVIGTDKVITAKKPKRHPLTIQPLVAL